MMISCGLVGLPNAGKSTLFNALTGGNALTAPYPFSTKNPNIGIFYLFDPYIYKLAQWFGSKKVSPPFAEIIDIAGLIKNAHKGEGLGNLFLSHIAQVDLIIHVIPFYNSPNIKSLKENYEIILYELAMHDYSIIEKNLKKIQKIFTSSPTPSIKEEIAFFEKYKQFLENEEFKTSPYVPNSKEEENFIKKWQFLVAKPSIVLLNVNNETFPEELIENVKVIFPHNSILIVDAKLLEDMKDLPVQEKEELINQTLFPSFYKDISYSILKKCNLIIYYTCNENESKAWIEKNGIIAIQAAEKVHSSIAKGFIKAEVISAPDLLVNKNPRIEGKTYVIENYDVILFKFKQ